MEHSELVREMRFLENLTAQERLTRAQRQRQEQIRNYVYHENNLHRSPIRQRNKKNKFNSNVRVQFPSNIILLDATARRDYDEVCHLLRTGHYDPNGSNEDGLTPIHQCAIDNSEQLLLLLLEYGGNVNIRDRDLWTPLHAAATCGHVPICKILIEHGADLLALNIDGDMPYDICDDETTLDFIETQMDQQGVTQTMIDEKRAEVEYQMLNDLQELVRQRSSKSSTESIDQILSYRNADGATPFHIACANGYQLVLDYLLQQHVSINHLDRDGWKGIHCAAFWCQQAILTHLILAGADIHEKTPDGRSALELCDDLDVRAQIIATREEFIREREQAAAAAAAQTQTKSLTHQLSNTRLQLDLSSLSTLTPNRSNGLYESRSSISSPYGSTSSLNRSSSIRRASIRQREKENRFIENFLDVLQAKDDLHDELEENLSHADILAPYSSEKTDDSLPGRAFLPTSTTNELTSLQNSTPPVPIYSSNTADTLTDVKRRREERRRNVSGPYASITTSPPMPIKDSQSSRIAHGNGNAMKYRLDDLPSQPPPSINPKKRICCTIF